MAWKLSQTKGELSHQGKVIDAHVYSGHGTGKNNAAMPPAGYKAEALRAVKAASDPSLQQIKALCLARLRES